MKPHLSVTVVAATTIHDLYAIGSLYPAKSPGEQEEMVHRHLIPEFRQQGQSKRTILVARLGERVVGTVQVVWESAEKDVLRQPGSATIHHLRTHPDLQGQGIATRLFDAARELATDHGATTLTLGVEPHNDRARRLYVAWGFGEYARYTGQDGEPLIAMSMALDEQEPA